MAKVPLANVSSVVYVEKILILITNCIINATNYTSKTQINYIVFIFIYIMSILYYKIK